MNEQERADKLVWNLMIKKFKLHWLTGRAEIIEGKTIADAFASAGYGAGAIRALDWYEVVEEEDKNEI